MGRTMPKTNFYLPGLQKGWDISKAKKLPPKPCLICGKPVYYKHCTKDRAKYCSLVCKYTASKGITFIRTKPKSGSSFICKTCGETFYRHPCEIKKGRVNYCSVKCRKLGNYNPYKKGILSSNWKGGTTRIGKYIYIKSYDHPNKNSDEYVAEHRLVMEKFLKRYLTTNENVHHRNGIKHDNRLENLEVVTHSNHYGEVNCPYCQNKFKVK